MKSPESEKKLITLDRAPSSVFVKHWFWDSWVLLTLTAAVLLSIKELCMVKNSHSSFNGLLYTGLGPLTVALGYFIKRKE